MAQDPRPASLSRRTVALSVLPLFIGVSLAMPAARPPQVPPAPAELPGAQAITVEGCLTKEGSAQRSSAAEQFVLTLAPGQSPVAAPVSPPSGGAVPAPPHKKMYALRSAPEAPRSFNTMVDHHVRITGTTTDGATTAPLAGRSPEATPYQAPVSTPGQTSGATGTPFDATNLPTLVVQSITSVASECR